MRYAKPTARALKCRCCGKLNLTVRNRAPRFKSSPMPTNNLCDGCWNDPSIEMAACRHGEYVPTHERYDNA